MRLLPSWLRLFPRPSADADLSATTPRAIAAPCEHRPADLFEAAEHGPGALQRATQTVGVDKLPAGVGKGAGLRVLTTDRGEALLAYTKPPMGQGGTYKVYRGVDLRSGEPRAIRAATGDDDGIWSDLAAECRAARLCENGLDAQELLQRARPGKAPRVYVAQPLMRGDLVSVVNQVEQLHFAGERGWQGLANTLALHVAQAVAPSLEKLHARGWAHRDVKPDNLLLDGQGVAHLADLGAAEPTSCGEAHALFGTVAYMAPELRKNRRADLFAADVYSLGATLWALVVGADYPFISCGNDATAAREAFLRTHEALRAWQAKGDRALGRDCPSVVRSLRKVRGPLCTLILDMMAREPHKRPCMAEVCRRLQRPEFTLTEREQDRLEGLFEMGRDDDPAADMAVAYAHRAWRQARGEVAADAMRVKLQQAL